MNLIFVETSIILLKISERNERKRNHKKNKGIRPH